jgi:hypothetical protein
MGNNDSADATLGATVVVPLAATNLVTLSLAHGLGGSQNFTGELWMYRIGP